MVQMSHIRTVDRFPLYRGISPKSLQAMPMQILLKYLRSLSGFTIRGIPFGTMKSLKPVINKTMKLRMSFQT